MAVRKTVKKSNLKGSTKAVTKKEASVASKIMRNPKASKSKKTAAAKTLSQRSRSVKTSARSGTITQAKARSAIKAVTKRG